MLFRTLFAAALLCVLATTPATAAPVTVHLRVEGILSTLYEGPLTTDGHAVDGGDGTGPHPCDGTNFGANPTPGATMISALDDARVPGGWHGTWSVDFEDFLLDTVGAETGTSFDRYWGTVLNYQPAPKGGCQQQVTAGDELLFALGDIYSQALLRLGGPVTAAAGPVRLTVVDGKTGMPVNGAVISAPGLEATTQADGSATLTLPPGIVRVKASKDGAIRSNALEICIFAQPAECGGFVPSTGPQGAVRDASAPTVRIMRPRHGRRYTIGPRLLRGSAADAGGSVTQVKLALRRHVDGRCSWWSGRRERFVGKNCRKVFFFAIGDDAEWSYLMPHRLPRGRYVLDVKAFDQARNREESFVGGRNRVVFRVANRRRPAARPRAAGLRKTGAAVDVMVVGKDGDEIARAKRVRTKSSPVTASGRSCRVAASTPLTALVRALRGVAGYHATDFGNCSRRDAASAAQVFVDRVAVDRNRGQNGWFYKVNDRAGTAGAGDPAGPRGRGRLRRGDRVLWFYCLFGSSGRGCQHSLRVQVGAASVAVGEPLTVRVRTYDDEGRSAPAQQAVVSLGAQSAVTGAAGVATLVPAGPGWFTVRATKTGSLPAFPREVRVT